MIVSSFDTRIAKALETGDVLAFRGYPGVAIRRFRDAQDLDVPLRTARNRKTEATRPRSVAMRRLRRGGRGMGEGTWQPQQGRRRLK